MSEAGSQADVVVDAGEPDVPSLAAVERAAIVRALEAYDGRTTKGKLKASVALGISLKTLYAKIARYALTEYVREGAGRRAAARRAAGGR